MRGYVLCGGDSRRMGLDKARLPHPEGGGTLLESAATLAADFCDGVTLLSGDGARYPHLGLRQLPDALPDAGPIGGILAALEDARDSGPEPESPFATSTRKPAALILPVDLPLLRHRSIALLRNAFDSAKPSIALAASQDGWHPVPSIWNPERCLPEIRRACAAGDYSLQRLQRRLSALPVELPEAELDNWNEPR